MTAASPAALAVHRNPDLRRGAADELRACGFAATEAPSLEGALALLAERSFDLVVCEADACGPRRRPVWQILLSATTGDTLVALVGVTNSHQELLASYANSRLLVGTPETEDLRNQTNDLVRRRFGAMVAMSHGAEGLDGPHFAERRVRTDVETTF